MFGKVQLPCLNVIGEARISAVNPLRSGEFCIIYTKLGIGLGQVIALDSKSGGKHGKHGAVPSINIVMEISYVGVQVFQRMH